MSHSRRIGVTTRFLRPQRKLTKLYCAESLMPYSVLQLIMINPTRSRWISHFFCHPPPTFGKHLLELTQLHCPRS